jgi:hypothetical protein
LVLTSSSRPRDTRGDVAPAPIAARRCQVPGPRHRMSTPRHWAPDVATSRGRQTAPPAPRVRARGMIRPPARSAPSGSRINISRGLGPPATPGTATLHVGPLAPLLGIAGSRRLRGHHCHILLLPQPRDHSRGVRWLTRHRHARCHPQCPL